MHVPSKTEVVKAIDYVQSHLRSLLQARGFRTKGRTANAKTSDGLVLVVNFQTGQFDPPGTIYIPGFNDSMYGKFTVNLGVFVPEVAKFHGGGKLGAVVQEYNCSIRTRLGEIGPEHADVRWNARPDDRIPLDIRTRLERDAFPFFSRFETRDKVLDEFLPLADSPFTPTPRIDCAIVLSQRGETEKARQLLAAQTRETKQPLHVNYVRRLAQNLGLGTLDP